MKKTEFVVQRRYYKVSDKWEDYRTYHTAIGAQGAAVELNAVYTPEKNATLRDDSKQKYRAVVKKTTIEVVELP